MRQFRKTFTLSVYRHELPFYIEQLVQPAYSNCTQVVEAQKQVPKDHAKHKNCTECFT